MKSRQILEKYTNIKEKFNKHKKVLLVIFALLVIFLALFGILGSSKKFLTNSKIAVIDLSAIEKTKENYEEILQLKQEISLIKADNVYLKQNVFSAVDFFVQANELQKKTKEQGLKAVNDNQKEVQILKKKQEINNRLQVKEEVLKKESDKELFAYNESLKKKYAEEILNLNLKLQVLTLQSSERESLIAQLKTIEQMQNEKFAQKREEALQSISQQMSEERKVAQKELENFTKKVSNVGLESNLDSKKLWQKTGAISAKIAKNEWLLKQKEQELKSIEEKIKAEIVFVVAEIAQKNGYVLVLTDVRVNVNAVDITNDVLQLITKEK